MIKAFVLIMLGMLLAVWFSTMFITMRETVVTRIQQLQEGKF